MRGSSHLELSDLAHGQDNGQPVYKANHGWARDEAHKLCQTQQGCQRLKAGRRRGVATSNDGVSKVVLVMVVVDDLNSPGIR